MTDREEALALRVVTAVWVAALMGVQAAMVTGSGVFTLAVMAVAFYLMWRVA
jgi:hypothetical protein